MHLISDYQDEFIGARSDFDPFKGRRSATSAPGLGRTFLPLGLCFMGTLLSRICCF